MKKIILLIFTILILCSCSKNNPYKNYTKYNIKNLGNANSYIDGYSYYNGKEEQKYIIEDMSNNPDNIYQGLFYCIGNDEYILLDKIKVYNYPIIYKFSDNKLYIADFMKILEFTLDRENTTSRILSFEYIDIPFPDETTVDKIQILSIDNILNNSIFLKINAYRDGLGSGIESKVECSLDTFKCEVIEE